MDVQQLQWSHQEPIHSQPDLRHPSYNELTNHHLQSEDPMSEKPIKKLPSSRSLACEKSFNIAPIQSRSPPTIQPDDGAATPPNAYKRVPTASHVSTQPVPPVSSITPEKCLSKPLGLDKLLNPTSVINNDDSSRSNNSNEAKSRDMATIPQLAIPALPSVCVKSHSLEDGTLPSIKPTPLNRSLRPLSYATTPMSPAARGAGFSTARLPSATTNKPFVFHQDLIEPLFVPSASEPQSTSSPSFVSEAPSQSQRRTMTLDVAGGAIQVPCDFHSGSKDADEKRKRNASSSHRFRVRRKEKEQQSASRISGLEAQVQQLNKKNELLQNMLRQHGITLPSLSPSPIPKYVSTGGSFLEDTGTGASNARGNTSELTNEYHPAQWSPLQGIMPFEHMQILQHRTGPQSLFHPCTSSVSVIAPR